MWFVSWFTYRNNLSFLPLARNVVETDYCNSDHCDKVKALISLSFEFLVDWVLLEFGEYFFPPHLIFAQETAWILKQQTSAISHCYHLPSIGGIDCSGCLRFLVAFQRIASVSFSFCWCRALSSIVELFDLVYVYL